MCDHILQLRENGDDDKIEQDNSYQPSEVACDHVDRIEHDEVGSELPVVMPDRSLETLDVLLAVAAEEPLILQFTVRIRHEVPMESLFELVHGRHFWFALGSLNQLPPEGDAWIFSDETNQQVVEELYATVHLRNFIVSTNSHVGLLKIENVVRLRIVCVSVAGVKRAREQSRV